VYTVFSNMVLHSEHSVRF